MALVLLCNRDALEIQVHLDQLVLQVIQDKMVKMEGQDLKGLLVQR